MMFSTRKYPTNIDTKSNERANLSKNEPGKTAILRRLGARALGGSRPKPLLHLVVAYQACLLYDYAATRQYDEVGYTAYIEAASERRLFFRINF